MFEFFSDKKFMKDNQNSWIYPDKKFNPFLALLLSLNSFRIITKTEFTQIQQLSQYFSLIFALALFLPLTTWNIITITQFTQTMRSVLLSYLYACQCPSSAYPTSWMSQSLLHHIPKQNPESKS